MSTGTTRQFATDAMRHTEVRPLARFCVTIAVTLLSVCVTPCATTPLSAHSTSTARGESETGELPVRAAIRSTASSSSPRLPSGLAHEAH